MKKTLIILLSSFMLSACAPQTTPLDRPTVLVSFSVLEQLTQLIAGDSLNVESVIPAGAEAHSIELTSADMMRLGQADTVITLGLNFEPWMASYQEVRSQDAQVLVVSDGIDILKDVQGNPDPHIWLSPAKLRQMTISLYQFLIERFPELKDDFTTNTNLLLDRINPLISDAEALKADHRRNVFIVEHPAFAYLAQDLGVTQWAIADQGHEGDVDAKRLQSILSLIEAQEIPVIFYAHSSERTWVDTIALEKPVKVALLSSLERQDPELSGDLIDGMVHNLNILKEALQ